VCLSRECSIYNRNGSKNDEAREILNIEIVEKERERKKKRGERREGERE
jgi:hypothetical protein